MKQTAVEYLFEQLWETPKDKFTWHSILEQAKQMEKEQIINAYNMATKTKYSVAAHILGISTQPPLVENSEQYYKETYGE
jgi:uncharacterized protein (DUF169 family)